MGMGILLVVGASGDVGRGIVQAALQSGRKVVAAGRNAAKLAAVDGQESADRLARTLPAKAMPSGCGQRRAMSSET